MQPISYYNRHTAQEEVESVYGEAWLRWLYGSAIGRMTLHAVVKRSFFSKLYGWLMDRPSSRDKIQPFIETYGLDPNEFAEPVESFRSFNEFFYRRLHENARPLAGDEETLLIPADGRHQLIPRLDQQGMFWVKGVRMDLATLLGDADLAARYAQGSMLISRLCPVDYHRFHFPCSGSAGQPRAVAGSLWSVNPLALCWRPSILWENHRVLTQVDSPLWGRVTLIEVGATCVGAIEQTFVVNSEVRRGQEKGFFRFGGSCTLTLLEPDRIQWAEDLRRCSARNIELYARMGSVAGHAR